MAKISAVQEAIAEKIGLINLAKDKKESKDFKPLFVIIPAAVTALTITTFLVVRRFRSKSEF